MRSCLCTFLGDPLSCKFLHAPFHITRQCIGPVQLDDGVVDDLEEILWDQAALSVSSPMGPMYWAYIHKLCTPPPTPSGTISEAMVRVSEYC